MSLKQKIYPVILAVILVGFVSVFTQMAMGAKYGADTNKSTDTYSSPTLFKETETNPNAPVENSLSCDVSLTQGGEVYLPVIINGSANSNRASNQGSLAQNNILASAATLAPELDLTVATSIYTATQFIYTGNNPIQLEMAADTISYKRAAALRGIVNDEKGNSLSRVLISILNHPEYGCTFSRTDGSFDLVVNGGESLIIQYQKIGYLSSQRQLDVPVQDYAWLDSVNLAPYDDQVTTIDLTSQEDYQVAQGSLVTDDDGTRQATLLFPKNMQVTMKLPEGYSRILNSNASSFNVRATEYTIGENGPETMPGTLPVQSGYTYAVDFSVDEAEAIGATSVEFDQPVIFYVENFLDIPAGLAVPTGYYDKLLGQWLASDNGTVINILSIDDGLALVDTTGDDLADNGIEIGMTLAERERLVNLYTVGQSLWRVPITHFTPWDCNYPYGPPAGSAPPNLPTPEPDSQPDNECTVSGSIIGVHSQSLGEMLDIVGTPFRLHYQSNRLVGREGAYTMKIPLSGDSIPANVKQIMLEIQVAGQQIIESFAAEPNQVYSFKWDGKDGYGRLVQGRQPITIRVGYVYDAEYQRPAELAQSFAAYSGVPITGIRARQELTLWQEWETGIGGWNWAAQKLGGWSLNIHHVYDPGSHTLYYGDGTQRSAEAMGQVISTVAGNGGSGNTGNGGLATEAQIRATDVAVGADGSIYIASNPVVRSVDPEGIISTFAGGGNPADGVGDGGPATQAKLSGVKGLAIGPDGSLYISEAHLSTNRVRKVTPDGIITTVAGGSSSGYSGDGGLATLARLNDPGGLDVGADGSLFIADSGNDSIRRVGPDGIITTFAGDGTSCQTLNPCGDGGPANQARLFSPDGVAVAPDGTVYITQYNGNLAYVGLDGIINTLVDIAGVWQGQGIAFDSAGNLYISYYWGTAGSLFQVLDDGSLVKIGGNGVGAFAGDGGPATQASLKSPAGIDFGPDDSLYVSDQLNYRVRKVGLALVGFSTEDIGIPSEDGALFYVFDGSGRHLRTLNALTGATLFEFGYNIDGLLVQVMDGDGNVTVIERNGDGNATAVIGPYGQRTTLNVNDAGFLAMATNPAGESHQFIYNEDGLLFEMRDPRTQLYAFNYDPLGLLTQDADPAGGTQSLARTELSQGYLVTHTTELDRTTLYQVETLPSTNEVWTTTAPDNTQTETTISYRDANVATTYADGTMTSSQDGADPRFGMLATVQKGQTVNTPGGLNYNSSTQRMATLQDEHNPLSLIDLTEVVTINGRPFTSTFSAANRQFTLTSAEGRVSIVQIDMQGRVIQESVPSFSPVEYSYDARGRLETVRQGTGMDARIFTLSYGTDGYLATMSDPLGRSVNFSYDAAGRVTTQLLPGNRTIHYGYDANGNLTSLTPPAKPAHTFAYTPVNLSSSYTPPDVGIGSTQTQYDYNYDRQLTQISRPDGQTLNYNYDDAGRLQNLILPRGPISYTYDLTTGNLNTIEVPEGLRLLYAYDGALVTEEALHGVVSGTVATNYDDNFRVVAQSINNSQTVNFQYDADDLITGAGDLTLDRNAQHGLLTGSSLDNVTTTMTYNDFGELATYEANYNATALYAVDFSYDKLGRIVQRIETVQGVTATYEYDYDAAGRLSEVQENSVVVETYTYDNNGNRLTDLSGPVGSYDDQDRLSQYGSATYSYNKNGDLESKTDGGQTTSYDYDILGNLMAVTLPNGTEIAYLVDGQNRRVGKLVNGTLQQGFLYEDALNPVAELDASNNVVSRFVYASRTNVPDYMIRGGVTYRIVSDHLGSVRLVVNSTTGAVAQRLDYDGFGNVVQDTNPGFQPFGFAGGIYDEDIGLVRFGARDYDATVGRWTTKDPIGFDGGDSNLYVYVANDPINFIDQSGLYRGLFPGKGPDKHHNRNSNQSCPPREPSENQCYSDGGWDNEGKSPTHGGYNSYRGTGGNKGYQCVYDDSGDLVTDKEYEGTYDYISPYNDDGFWSNPFTGVARPIGHFVVDVIPWIIFGN